MRYQNLRTLCAIEALTAVRVFLLVVIATSCRTWVAQPPDPNGRVSTRNDEPLRITKADSTTIVLDSVTISADSLVGFAEGEGEMRVTIPLSEVRNVERRQLSRPAKIVRNYYIVVGTIGSLWMLWALK